MRALVIYKKSYYELYGYAHPTDPTTPLPPPTVLETLRLSHLENQRTLEAVQAAFTAAGCPYDLLYRGDLQAVQGYDLLVSVGGDGTFLEVARASAQTPLLGINSDVERSTALFCAADRYTIEKYVKTFLEGKLRAVLLQRLQLTLNDTAIPTPVLNEVLLAHANPAAMTSYILQIGADSEPQKSSGVWIATAAGSTAAIRSAGGQRMPLRSRRLQYRVREPYRADGPLYRLTRGFVPPGGVVQLTSRMRCGRLFLDGPHLHLPLGLGDVVTLSPNAPPLKVLGLDITRRQRF